MRLGFRYLNNGTCESLELASDVACLAGSAGVHSLWVSSHLLDARQVTQQLAVEQQRRVVGSFPDALLWLTALGAASQVPVLGVAVLVPALYERFSLVRQVATAQLTTRGRLALGVEVGWWREEFQAVGADFPQRGDLLDASLDQLRDDLAILGTDEQVRLVVGGGAGGARRAGVRGADYFPSGSISQRLGWASALLSGTAWICPCDDLQELSLLRRAGCAEVVLPISTVTDRPRDEWSDALERAVALVGAA